MRCVRNVTKSIKVLVQGVVNDMAKGKIHLAMPDTSESLCHHAYLGEHDPRSTRDPDEATCGHCLNHIKENQEWYAEQWAKESAIFDKNIIRKSFGLKPVGIECNKPIRMMVMAGTDFCSENCRDKHAV